MEAWSRKDSEMVRIRSESWRFSGHIQQRGDPRTRTHWKENIKYPFCFGYTWTEELDGESPGFHLTTGLKLLDQRFGLDEILGQKVKQVFGSVMICVLYIDIHLTNICERERELKHQRVRSSKKKKLSFKTQKMFLWRRIELVISLWIDQNVWFVAADHSLCICLFSSLYFIESK